MKKAYRSQSTVKSKLRLFAGRPTVVKTIRIVSKPAGTDPEPIDATVVVTLKNDMF